LGELRAELRKIADENERFAASVRRYTKFIKDHADSDAAANLRVMLRSSAMRMQMGAGILMQRKDYRRAEVYLKRARLFSPKDNRLAYNLACALARNGKKDEAIKMLAEAVKLGFANFGHIRKDPDLESLREDPEFKKIMDLLGGDEGKKAEKKEEPAPLL
jgi:predicted Zn-dependent protease